MKIENIKDTEAWQLARSIIVFEPDECLEHSFAGEILKAEGLFDFDRLTSRDCKLEDLKRGRCVMSLHGVYKPFAAQLLHEYVRQGGRLLTVVPTGALAHRLGIAHPPTVWNPNHALPNETEATGTEWVADGKVSLHERSGLCACPEPLLCPGETSQAIQLEGTILADLLDASGNTRGPAIIRKRIGDGIAVILAYDIVGAVLRLRHGTWNLGPTPEMPSLTGPRHMHGFVGVAERHSRQYPLADIHQDLLRELLIDLIALPIVPRIWHLPDARRVAVFMKSDGCGEEGAPLGLELAERYGHKHNFFRPPVSQYDGSLIRQWGERGHFMSLEVNIDELTRHRSLAELDAAAHDQIRRVILDQTRRFMQETGLGLTDIVIHGCQWTGAPMAQILLEQGCRMPFHFCSHDPRMNRDNFGPFSVASAMPMRYFDKDRGLLDLFFQPCTGDDSQSVAEPGVGTVGLTQIEYAEAIIRWVIESRDQWHVPHIGTFHPCYLVRPKGDPRRTWEAANMVYATMTSLEIELGSLENWSKFVQARDALRVEMVRSDADAMVMKLTAPVPIEGLTIVAEARQPVSEILVDGKPHRVRMLDIEGHHRSAAVISMAGGQRIELTMKP